MFYKICNFYSKGSKKSKNSWSLNHLNDYYVKLSKKENYKSRAAYKVEHFFSKYKELKKGNINLELGAYPGSWTQIIRDNNQTCKLICVDLYPMDNDFNFEFIQGDVFKSETKMKICDLLKGEKVSNIFSDFCVNMEGNRSLDLARTHEMNLLIFNYCINFLKNKGNLVMKSFDVGNYYKMNYLGNLFFESFKPIKPKASRKESSEIYFVGLNYKQSLFNELKDEENSDFIFKKLLKLNIEEKVIEEIWQIFNDNKEITRYNNKFLSK